MDATSAGGKASSSSHGSLHKARRAAFGGLIILAGIIVASLVWKKVSGSSLEAKLALARAAISQGDRHEFDLLAVEMERAGYPDHARLARGEWHLAEARKCLKTVNQLHEWHSVAWPLEVLIDSGCWALTSPADYHVFFYGAITDPRLAVQMPALTGLLPLQVRAQGQLQLAYKQFSEMAQDTPQWNEAVLPAAEALLRLRETGAVVPLEGPYRLLHQAIQARPDDVEAHRWLALVCMDLNVGEEALEELRAVGRLDPRDGRPFRSLGLLLHNRMRFGPAVEAYREALARDLKPAVRVEVIAELAALQASKDQPAEALKTLDLCPAELRARTDLRTIRAEALWASNPANGRDQAVELLEKVLAIQPDYVPALRLRGRIHLAEEHAKEARVLLERALQATPHDHEARHLLAQCLELLSQPQAAAEQRRQADKTQRRKKELEEVALEAAKDVLSEEPRLRAAKLSMELGNPQAARQWLLAALACNPRSEDAQRMLADLNRTAAAGER